MLWPLVCAIIYLILSVRVLADASLDISEAHSGVRLSLRAWGLCLCIDRPARIRMDGKNAAARTRRLKALWPLLRAALRAVTWGQTDIRMRVGFQEASLTAMLAGAARSGGSVLQAIAGQRFPCEVRVEPDFRATCFVLAGRCIFSLVPGDVMFAVIKAAVKKTQREGFSWLSIPLKA